MPNALSTLMMRQLVIFLATFGGSLHAQGTVTFPAFAAAGKPVWALVEPIRAPVATRNGVAQSKLLHAPATMQMAAGKWTLRVSHGPDFRLVSRDFDLHDGETVSFGPVEFHRLVDLRPLGWFSGSLTEAPGLDWAGHSYRMDEIGGLGLLTDLPASLPQPLAAIRQHSAATFATRLHAALPFHLAAGLIDGLLIDGDESLRLWSMLLDHGYALAPVAGPGGRLIVPCAEGFRPACIAEAIRQQRTVVSTGPALVVNRHGGQIDVSAWARQDRPDRLLRLELWAHNRVIATREVTAGEQQNVTATLTWTPQSADEWVAVRVVADSGWAISAAEWATERKPPTPLLSHLKMVFPEIASQQQAGALASIWSGPPGTAGAKRLAEIEMERNELEVDAPVTGVVRVELADGRRLDVRIYDASGVRELVEELAVNPRRGEALLDWALYEDVLRRLRRVSLESRL